MPDEPDDDADQNTDEAPRLKGCVKGTHDIQQYCGSACVTPLCDQAEVDIEADKWAQLWNENGEAPKLRWGTIDQLPTSPQPNCAALRCPSRSGRDWASTILAQGR